MRDLILCFGSFSLTLRIAVRFLYDACVFVEANLWLRIKKRVL